MTFIRFKTSGVAALILVCLFVGAADKAFAQSPEIRSQYQELKKTFAQERQKLRRAKSREEVARSALNISRQIDAFRSAAESSGLEGTSVSQVSQLSRNLQMLQQESQRHQLEARELIHQARKREQTEKLQQLESANKEKESEQEETAASSAADTVEDWIDDAEEAVETVLSFFGL